MDAYIQKKKEMIDMENKKRIKKYLILSLMALELSNLKHESELNNDKVIKIENDDFDLFGGTIVSAKEKKSNDLKVKEYISKQCKEIKQLASKKNLNKLSKKFKKLINFLNGNASIKGITFDELKEDTKTEIKEKLYKLDLYIDKKIPDYKNRLSKKYSAIKKFIGDKSKQAKKIVKDNIPEDTYNDFKDSKDNLVDTVKYDFDLVKEIIDKGVQKIKK